MAADDQDDTPDDPSEPPAPRRWGRILAVALLLLLGLGAVGSGAAGLYWEHTRKPTAAEKSTASEHEIALRWRIRTIAQIFPPVVQDPDGGGRAYRIGYTQPVRCAEAVDPAAARILAARGCKTVLRATYTDSSRTLLTTAAVAVMPDTRSADAAADDLIGVAGDVGGVHALAFPGTAAEGFQDGQRQKILHQPTRAPYVVLETSGWADGRPKIRSTESLESFSLGDTLLIHFAALFAQAKDPCRIEGVRC